MSTSFFELVKTRHYKEGDLPELPEHTDMHRLTIDPGSDAYNTKMSIQLSSTLRQKGGLAYIYLSEQELLRLLGAIIERLFNFTGVEPQIPRSMYSSKLNQLDIFSPGKTA